MPKTIEGWMRRQLLELIEMKPDDMGWVLHKLQDIVDHGYESPIPIPMRLTCPVCGELHIDEGEFATKIHHTHACQKCGNHFRPCMLPTVGVRFLPGCLNTEQAK